MSKTQSHITGESRLERGTKGFAFFGHFGFGNFGNDITIKAALDHLRRLLPNAEAICICTGPEATAAAHNVVAVPISKTFLTWKPTNRLARALRSLFFSMPSELYRWLKAFTTLRETDVFVIPGTGLITDAYGLLSWGPYNLFKWSLVAKLRGCKLFFISVGAGPIYGRAGKWLLRSALALADFRSYRDNESKEYLLSIGAGAATDRVYPDLAFSIAEEIAPKSLPPGRRRSVGLGLMLHDGKFTPNIARDPVYAAYLEQLVIFVKWLFARQYDIRFLIGGLSDRIVATELKALLKDRLGPYDEDRIIDEPISSVQDLLAQIAQTDAVVATRFHNALLSLALNKPVISISFHPKCTSLMQDMGLQEYCQDIHRLNGDKLIEQFCQLEKKAETLKQMIAEKVAERRKALDEQYRLIFHGLLPGGIPASSSRINDNESLRLPLEARK